MKILVLVFTVMTSAFLTESCQGDRTQGQQSVLKLREVQSRCTWCGTISETGLQMAGCWVLFCAHAWQRQRKSEGYTPRGTNITTVIFLHISRTALSKNSNEAGSLWFLLSSLSVHTVSAYYHSLTEYLPLKSLTPRFHSTLLTQPNSFVSPYRI
jgi:hypothetical protein